MPRWGLDLGFCDSNARVSPCCHIVEASRITGATECACHWNIAAFGVRRCELRLSPAPGYVVAGSQLSCFSEPRVSDHVHRCPSMVCMDCSFLGLSPESEWWVRARAPVPECFRSSPSKWGLGAVEVGSGPAWCPCRGQGWAHLRWRQHWESRPLSQEILGWPGLGKG